MEATFRNVYLHRPQKWLIGLLILAYMLITGTEVYMNINKEVYIPPPIGKQGPRLITVFCKDIYRRLGNNMFNYASLLGIAKSNGMTPVFPKELILREIFETPMKTGYFDENFGMWHSHGENLPCAYDKTTKHLEDFNTVLSGYFQSWKYFKNAKDELRNHFKFKIEISDRAEKYVKTLLAVDRRFSEAVKIGVHIRRGDIMNENIIQQGYVTANASWIKHAMDYYRKRYTNAVFIVCSDDIDWCKNNILAKDVVFSESGDMMTDLAILTQCNHTVMTVGTFGWWAAWLTNGTTVYFKDWPRPNSRLASEVDKNDYFLPNWIPM